MSFRGFQTATEMTAEDGLSLPKMDFDRILLDVPCSSDGTVRKDPKRLRRWDVTSALRRGAWVLTFNAGSSDLCMYYIYAMATSKEEVHIAEREGTRFTIVCYPQR